MSTSTAHPSWIATRIRQLIVTSIMMVVSGPNVFAAPCSEDFVNNTVRQTASASSSTVAIKCDLNLRASDRITKRLIVEGADASNVVINCNGATLDGGRGTYNYERRFMVEVRSKFSGNSFVGRPSNVTVQNCRVNGPVRVLGLENISRLKTLSRTANFVAEAQRQAPTNVTFRNMHVTAVGKWTPFYVGVGVTGTSLYDSELDGKAVSVAIYLDAESSRTTISGNNIHTRNPREVLAIDASDHNVIINNRFSALNNGGIYLYRNCGERGVSRHTTPSHNKIINNRFYYNRYNGGNPAVYIGSRNGKTRAGRTGYCNDDRDSAFGSGVSNKDFAKHNIIMQNQIYKRSVSDMIRNRNAQVNTNNHIDHNQTVTTESVDKNRLAGCFIDNHRPNFLLHGRQTQTVREQSGQFCIAQTQCQNSVLSSLAVRDCRLAPVAIDCQVTANNNGCRKTVNCPTNTRVVNARVACNLEFGPVTTAQVNSTPFGALKVVRKSDNVANGLCEIGNNRTREGEIQIVGISNARSVSVSCKEHDKNGGDCHIRGQLFCKGSSIIPLLPAKQKISDAL